MAVNANGKIFYVKLVALGETASGKSSVTLNFAKDQFHENRESTVGAEFLTKSLNLDSKIIKFEIWDTAGQERYHSLAPMYYRGAQAVIVVYDITDRESYLKALNWIKELNEKFDDEFMQNTVIALVGNKCDLEHKRAIEYKEAESYAKDKNLIFMETSAKTSHNITELFTTIAKQLPLNNDDVSTQNKSIKVNSTGSIKKRKKRTRC